MALINSWWHCTAGSVPVVKTRNVTLGSVCTNRYVLGSKYTHVQVCTDISMYKYIQVQYSSTVYSTSMYILYLSKYVLGSVCTNC